MGVGGVQSWGCAREPGEDALGGLSCSRRACVCACTRVCVWEPVCVHMGTCMSVGESTGSPMTGAWPRLSDCGGAWTRLNDCGGAWTRLSNLGAGAWTRLDNGGGLLVCSGSAHTAITADGSAQPTAWRDQEPRRPRLHSLGEASLTFSLEIMLASASSLALFWCTSLLASIFA